MKKIIVLFAFFMLIKPIIPVVEYVVFYDYIKNELCINKENKALQCNGKCHLKKELAKAATTEEKSSSHSFSIENILVFCEELPFLQWNHFFSDDLFQNYFDRSNLYQSTFYQFLLKPPASLS
ncbi:hypothetical protein MG290_04335 [Flavobacterium sp. CBA20B-1]|uniref:hypothetical protein n=1 Tax=unclassified Flavobacterium TaxID=196869 RepID=UPI002224C668|nr:MULTISPECIES: hypothetical protein [unclassified Flavobacterium]WCM42919.1 hypothetical protein MG290_04335 [Flavobacterium sp. CBA20B-1]